jgi:hypothetical protein
MLSYHPAVSDVDEFDFALAHTPDVGWPALDEYVAFLERLRGFSQSGLRVDRRLTFVELVRSFHCQRHAASGQKIWADVIHSAFHRCPEIWPRARYVHVLRDPRDVARSCVGMGWYGNSYRATEIWLTAERRWDLLCERTPSDRRHEVRYEELVRDPKGELTRLCEFLGLAYEPRMLSYSEHTTYEAPDPNLVEQWRTKMTPREIQLVEAAVGELLARRGYASSDYPKRVPGRLERALLAWDSRWRRLGKAVDRYGIALALEHRLAQWGPQSFLAFTQRRVNAIDELHLK